jgi:acetyl esterase
MTVIAKAQVNSLRVSYRLAATASWITTKPPHGIRVIDIDVPLGDAVVLKAKVFEPSFQFAVQNPLIIHFHGGGMCAGSCENTAYYALMELSSMLKCTIISVDYRLAPEHPFPAGPNDAVASCDWIQEHCVGKYPCNGTTIVMGDSTGGLLAVLCCLRAKKPLDGAVLFYPHIDSAVNEYDSWRKYAKGHALSAAFMNYLFHTYLRMTCAEFEEKYKDDQDVLCKAFPGKTKDEIVTAKMPKTFLVTCAHDILQDEAKRFSECIQDVQVHHYVAEHGFMSTMGKNDSFLDCVDRLGQWLKQSRG